MNLRVCRALAAGLFLSLFCLPAQAQSYEAGQFTASMGYGFGNFAQSIFSSYRDFDDFNYTSYGPLFAKAELMLTDRVGMGVNFAYITADVTWTDETRTVSNGDFLKNQVDWASYSVLARMNFHLGNNDKVDPYIGFGFGYRDGITKFTDNDPDFDDDLEIESFINLGMEFTGGVRFFFNDYIGAYSEIGLGKALIQFGLVGRI